MKQCRSENQAASLSRRRRYHGINHTSSPTARLAAAIRFGGRGPVNSAPLKSRQGALFVPFPRRLIRPTSTNDL